MRLFVALSFSDGTKAKLDEYIKSLRPLAREFKWVKAKNLHLTLKFLGECNSAQRENIITTLRESLAETPIISLQRTSPGCFPNIKKPRVFFLALKPDPLLITCQSTIENAMSALGFETENRPFRPHLTLARIKDSFKAAPKMSGLFAQPYPSFTQTCDNIELIQSQLTPAGAIYKTVQRFPLKK